MDAKGLEEVPDTRLTPTLGVTAVAYPPMPVPSEPVFSRDGFWWWDGGRWLPAYSPDRRWRFDGHRWLPAPQRVRPPRWLFLSGALWLTALSGWLLYGAVLLVTVGNGTPPAAAVYVLVGLAAVAAIATCVWGLIVGRRKAMRWLWPAAAVGTAVQMFWYAVAMLAAPAPDGSEQGTAAGAGVALLTLPTALIILALLWLGAALGVLSCRMSQRRFKR
jgi:hypothetical protein